MDEEMQKYIRDNVPFKSIPSHILQNWRNSGIDEKAYGASVLEFSIQNQLRYRGNLVQKIYKPAQEYYEKLVKYSRESLLLYPYHLSDIIAYGLQITPFIYYTRMMETIMQQEKSYDSLPNFTAADCVRLMGIGRNEYIDLMNTCRSGRKLFRRKNVKELLPTNPVKIPIDHWWVVHVVSVTEYEVESVSTGERALLDDIIDLRKKGMGKMAGLCNRETIYSLYNKGLVYLEVPISENDYVMVPPLEGFVMNRVLGDYFETLLYKIFVSIDEQTSVGELSSVLEIDIESVKNAVSLYCRLGFAKKKTISNDSELHASWNRSPSITRHGSVSSVTDPLLLELDEVLAEAGLSSTDESEPVLLSSPTKYKRVAFLFDSTLTAFLMMGNLTPGLKNHAVTMFEVGKLSEESIDSLLVELEKISTDDCEGEAQRYFEHALVLRDTIKFLRNDMKSPGLDLIRCESLQSLDSATCSRLLNKNYTLLVSMAPLSREIKSICSISPPHLGPAVPEMNSAWFKLYLAQVSGCGPPTLLLPRGTRLRKMPRIFRSYYRVHMTTWGHDATPLLRTHLLFAVNEALLHSAVLLQGYGDTTTVAFPISPSPNGWASHPVVQKLADKIDLEHNCGFLTMVRLVGPQLEATDALESEVDGLSDVPNGPWAILDCDFGIPLFSASVNKEVCSAISQHRLWEPDSLQAVVKANEELGANFLDFIGEKQGKHALIPKDDLSLMPHKSWIFDDGSLKLWDGR